MNEPRPSTPRERMQLAFDLFELGEQMMRQNLKRQFPGETEEQIEARIRAWLLERPGAERGDGPQAPSSSRGHPAR